MSDSGAGTTSRTRIITAAVGLALIVVIGLLVVRLGGDSDGDGGPTGSSAEPSASPSPEPTDATPSDAASPGQPAGDADETGSGASASPGSSQASRGPVRVGFGRSAQPTDDLRVSVARVERIRSKAGLPGETSRPALRMTVRVENLTDRTVPIGTALTNVYYGKDRSPASLVSRPGGKPFPAEVRPGSTASGVFVYNVPPQARDQVVLEVIVDAKARTVEFSGNCTTRC